MDNRAEIREFLTARRARITPGRPGCGTSDGTTWLEPVTDEQYQAAHQD